MTWRRVGTTVLLAIALMSFSATGAMAQNTPQKAAMLAYLQADQTRINGWTARLGEMIYLGKLRAPMSADLASGSTAVNALHQQTLGDSSSSALNADMRQIGALDASLMKLEDPKIGLASLANDAAGRVVLLVRIIEVSGGLDPSSPGHAQLVALQTPMKTANLDINQAVLILGQATLAGYPASLSLLFQAHALIKSAEAALQSIEMALRQLPVAKPLVGSVQKQAHLDVDLDSLNMLRIKVSGDPNLDSVERKNLLDEITSEMVAVGRLNRCVAIYGNGGCNSESSTLQNLDPYLLIRPKAEIMMANASARAAIAQLNDLLPSIESGIANASAQQDPARLHALVSDLTWQLTTASSELAPLDAELEPMAFSPAQHIPDLELLQSAVAAVSDADKRIVAARTDAGQLQFALSS